MIIHSNTEEGQKAKIFLKDGTECKLPIKSYDTVTKTAVHYEFDSNGQIKMNEWSADGKKMTRDAVLTITVLDGSWAEIDSKRV